MMFSKDKESSFMSIYRRSFSFFDNKADWKNTCKNNRRCQFVKRCFIKQRNDSHIDFFTLIAVVVIMLIKIISWRLHQYCTSSYDSKVWFVQAKAHKDGRYSEKKAQILKMPLYMRDIRHACYTRALQQKKHKRNSMI